MAQTNKDGSRRHPQTGQFMASTDTHSENLAAGMRNASLLSADAFEQLATGRTALGPGIGQADNERLRQVNNQLRDYARVGGAPSAQLIAERDTLQSGLTSVKPLNDPASATPVAADRGIVPVAHLDLTHSNALVVGPVGAPATNDSDGGVTYNRESPRGSGATPDPYNGSVPVVERS